MLIAAKLILMGVVYMRNEYFESRLKESLGYGFIHSTKYQDSIYSPKLVMNNQETGETVLTELQNQFERCESFFFNVAFISEAGIAMLKSHLHDLALKGIRGRLLISPYLDFNDPNALYELLKLTNVDVRMTDPSKNMHAKVYLFDHKDEQVVIAGSSNLTHTALKMNYEWNIKLTSSENGEFIHHTHKELETLWDKSIDLSEELIETYKSGRKQTIHLNTNPLLKEETIANYQTLKPNQMQVEATKSLNKIRSEGANKALVISATGTGKTYLSAFDVKQYQPDKFLFIVHREQILNQAKDSFQKVIEFQDNESCIYRSGMDISDKKYVFATIQTLSRAHNLEKLSKDLFDYILIDEVHRAGAHSYQTVVDHFDPDFFLGMTATPERTDDYNIFELFDYNIAYEIRLQDALSEDMLTPFIYYGVSDISNEDGVMIDDNSKFSDLVTDSRVKHILDKIHYYGSDKQKTKGLIFCSRNEEANELAIKLNQEGLKTRALSGSDRQEVREEVIKDLEDGNLDYILTVDIFNEGVDIPAINQIIMLRHTQSSIVFVQQLGRGLRKHPNKEFVTIIDFIGNYNNNYMIPMALFGDNSYNKDNYRRDLVNRNQINGITTINFEEIAREQIFNSIQKATLYSLNNLKKGYSDLKNKIGHIPFLMDFVNHQSLEPHVIFSNNKFKNHSEFITYMEGDTSFLYSSNNYPGKVLFFLTNELMNGKRPHELILFKELIIGKGVLMKEEYLRALDKVGAKYSDKIIQSVENLVTLEFFNSTDQKKYGSQLIKITNDGYELNSELINGLQDNWYLKFLFDIINVGLHNSKQYPKGYLSELQVGQKYTRKDVSRLLNYATNGSSTMYGYSLNEAAKTVPVFINYHKTEKTNAEIKYEDEFLSDNLFQWFTKANRTLGSKVEKQIINHQQLEIDLHLFVKKDDLKDPEHYYLGKVDVIPGSAEQTRIDGKNIVKMLFKLRHSVPYGLYHYFLHD